MGKIQNKEADSLFQITRELGDDFKHELPGPIGFFSLEMPRRGCLRKLGKGPELGAPSPLFLLRTVQSSSTLVY